MLKIILCFCRPTFVVAVMVKSFDRPISTLLPIVTVFRLCITCFILLDFRCK